MTQEVKNLLAMQGTWVGKISWRWECNPLQYSCLENPMDRGAWQATVHRVVELDTSEQLTLSLSQNFRLFFPSSLARRSSSHCVQFAFLSDLNKKRKSYKWDKIKTIIMPRGKKNQLHFPWCVIKYFHSNKDYNHTRRIPLRRCWELENDIFRTV